MCGEAAIHATVSKLSAEREGRFAFWRLLAEFVCLDSAAISADKFCQNTLKMLRGSKTNQGQLCCCLCRLFSLLFSICLYQCVKSFKNDAENKTTATAFSQVSQVSETQVTQNDKTNSVLPLFLPFCVTCVVVAVVAILFCETCEKTLSLSSLLFLPSFPSVSIGKPS
jgi:hypothetical protein